MKKLNFFSRILPVIMLALLSWQVWAQEPDSTTWCDFETLSSDTSFKDLGELPASPLYWVFNTKDPDGTDHLPATGHMPVLADGVSGQSMQFDGTSEWVLLQKPYDAKDPFASPRKEFSLSVWFNAERTTVNPPKKPEQFIVMIGSNNGMALMIRNDSLWAAASTRDHSKVYQNGNRLTGMVVVPFTKTHEWVNVVMTFEGQAVNDTASLFHVYMDGQLIGTDTVPAPMFFQDLYCASAVGAQYKWNALSNALGDAGDPEKKYPDVSYVAEGDVDCYFKGQIDELKTWKVALNKWDAVNETYAYKESYVYNFDAQNDGDSIILDSGDGVPYNVKYLKGDKDDSPLGHITLTDDNQGGKALQLNGADEYILVQGKYENYPEGAQPFGFKMTELSATAWIKPVATHVNPPKSPSQTIIKIGHANGIALDLKNDTLWAAVASRDRYEGSGFMNNLIIKAPFTAAGKWSLVGVSFEGDTASGEGTLSLFIDGKLAASATFDTCVLFRSAFTNATIGAYMSWGPFFADIKYLDDHTAGHFFKGEIGEVTIAKKALSTWDMNNQYLEGKVDYLYNFDDQQDGDSIILDADRDTPFDVKFLKGDKDDSPLGHITLADDNMGGKALQLNGADEFILVQGKYENYPEGAQPFGFKMTELSATAWINPVATHVNPPKSPSQTIIKIGHANGIALDIKNDTLWAAVAARDRYEGSGFMKNLIVKAPFTAAGEWSLVGVSFKGDPATGDGELDLYINGELAASATFDTCVLFRSAFTNTTIGAYMSWGPFFADIGYIDDHTAGHFFKGLIGEVKISKKAIDPNHMRKDWLLSLDVPQVYYKFDEQMDGDSVIVDSCGNWNAQFFNTHLTHDEANAANPLVLPAPGYATFVDGLDDEGKALQFNGSSDWILVQNKYDGYYPEGVPPFGDSYDDLSVRLWINPVKTSIAPPKAPEQMIIHVGHGNGVAMMIKNDTLWAGVAIRDRVDKKYNSNEFMKVPFDLTDQWSQVAVVFKGKAVNDTLSTAYLYLNGEAVDSVNITGDKMYTSYFSSSVIGGQYSWNPLGPMITYAPDGETNCYFDGLMDNILITKSALTADDIHADYQAHAPNAVPALVRGDVKVWPNPTRGNLYLDLGELQDAATIEILNLTGRVVLSEKIGTPHGREQISLGGLSNGLYIIRVISGNKVYTSKVQLFK